MNDDVIFVIGVCLAFLAIPSLVSAYADRRFPTLSVVVLAAGAALVIWKWREDPALYAWDRAPDAFYRVVAMILH